MTGIGAVTPIGSGAEGLWAGVLANRSAVQIDRFDASPFPSRTRGPDQRLRAEDHLDAKRARRLDQFSQLSVAAARMAIRQAAWTDADRSDGRTGVWIGSALGGVAFGEEQHAKLRAGGVRAVAPTLATAVFGGAGASNVAIDLGIRGPALGNANSCASGAVAIGQAFQAVRSGMVDVAVAGGAEAPLAPLTHGAFAMIRVLSQRNDDPHCIPPFDRRPRRLRDGRGCGDARAGGPGAGRAARRHDPGRGGRVRRLDRRLPPHRPLPSGEAAAAAITTALADAGTAERGDRLRQRARLEHAAQRAGGRRRCTSRSASARGVPVSGTKGLYGHALGASGAIEAAITVMALRHGLLPGTCNLVNLDERCELHVLREPLAATPAAPCRPRSASAE